MAEQLVGAVDQVDDHGATAEALPCGSGCAVAGSRRRAVEQRQAAHRPRSRSGRCRCSDADRRRRSAPAALAKRDACSPDEKSTKATPRAPRRIARTPPRRVASAAEQPGERRREERRRADVGRPEPHRLRRATAASSATSRRAVGEQHCRCGVARITSLPPTCRSARSKCMPVPPAIAHLRERIGDPCARAAHVDDVGVRQLGAEQAGDRLLGPAGADADAGAVAEHEDATARRCRGAARRRGPGRRERRARPTARQSSTSRSAAPEVSATGRRSGEAAQHRRRGRPLDGRGGVRRRNGRIAAGRQVSKVHSRSVAGAPLGHYPLIACLWTGGNGMRRPCPRQRWFGRPIATGRMTAPAAPRSRDGRAIAHEVQTRSRAIAARFRFSR